MATDTPGTGDSPEASPEQQQAADAPQYAPDELKQGGKSAGAASADVNLNLVLDVLLYRRFRRERRCPVGGGATQSLHDERQHQHQPPIPPYLCRGAACCARTGDVIISRSEYTPRQHRQRQCRHVQEAYRKLERL